MPLAELMPRKFDPNKNSLFCHNHIKYHFCVATTRSRRKTMNRLSRTTTLFAAALCCVVVATSATGEGEASIDSTGRNAHPYRGIRMLRSRATKEKTKRKIKDNTKNNTKDSKEKTKKKSKEKTKENTGEESEDESKEEREEESTTVKYVEENTIPSEDTPRLVQGPSICMSIIAVEGTRLPSDAGHAADLDDDSADVIIEYEDVSPVLEDDFIDFQPDNDMMGLPVGIGPVAIGGRTADVPSGPGFFAEDFDFRPDEDENVVIPFVDEEEDERDTEEEFVCELYDGSTPSISGTDEQMLELRRLLNSGDLISAESSVDAIVSGGVMEDDMSGIAEMEGPGETIVSLPPGDIRLIDSNSDNVINSNGRRLANRTKYEGTKKILVVRVTDLDGKSVSENAKYVSDKFFGINGDKATMKSGLEACSFGKFVITNDYDGAVNEKLLSAPGVLEVDVNVRLERSSQAAVRAAGIRAVEKKLGVRLPGPFDHVAFVVEGCYKIGTSCAFAAYAYVNSWLRCVEHFCFFAPFFFRKEHAGCYFFHREIYQSSSPDITHLIITSRYTAQSLRGRQLQVPRRGNPRDGAQPQPRPQRWDGRPDVHGSHVPDGQSVVRGRLRQNVLQSGQELSDRQGRGQVRRIPLPACEVLSPSIFRTSHCLSVGERPRMADRSRRCGRRRGRRRKVVEDGFTIGRHPPFMATIDRDLPLASVVDSAF